MGIGGLLTALPIRPADGIDSTFTPSTGQGPHRVLQGLSIIDQEGEIHFIGQTKLDNGTSVGLDGRVGRLEPGHAVNGTSTANAQIDEAFLFAFGDWGRVEVGSRDAGFVPYVLRHSVRADPVGAPSSTTGYLAG